MKAFSRGARPMGRRGVALGVVIGVLALVLVYLVTAQIAIQSSLNQMIRSRQEILRQAATRQFLAQIARRGTTGSQKMESWRKTSEWADVVVEPATVAPGGGALRLLPGDAIAKIRWLEPPFAPRRYLVNLKGLRAGAIALDDAAASGPTSAGAAPAHVQATDVKAAPAGVSSQPAGQADRGVKK
jgi:hypothetical protein